MARLRQLENDSFTDEEEETEMRVPEEDENALRFRFKDQSLATSKVRILIVRAANSNFQKRVT